ncbi:hypothetical protein ACFCVY_12915 [Streptomyces sp. NPDC056411]|uniref:hypothetical protein n=1 Tax=Streptomyces sp. NPDC056411 TaxID=3345813 RepID=UPI0035DD63A8
MRRLITVPTVLLALAAAGCGEADEGGAASAGASSGGSGPGPQRSGPGTAAPPVPGQPVKCGVLKDALGEKGDVTLFADPDAGGTVGCAEARNVMSEFFLRAPREASDDRGTLTVRGWLCQYESGPTGTWITSCHKDRREMHTEEPSGSDSGPGSEEPGGPGAPGESQLPTLPGEPSGPLDEPSTEEL